MQLGDRKDYYSAETDFWKMIRSILQQREQNEFDKALSTVTESIEMLNQAEADPEMNRFYQGRMKAMQSFFKTLDSLFSAVLALEGLVSLSSLKTMVEKVGRK
ncbi:MAG: hypothetical protein P8Y72_14350 [Anaerolineales bacterium]